MIAECPTCGLTRLSDKQEDLDEFQERHTQHASFLAKHDEPHTLLWLRPYTAICLHPLCTWQASAGPPLDRADWNRDERKIATRTVRESFKQHHQQ